MVARNGVDGEKAGQISIPPRPVLGASCTLDCGSHPALRWYCAQAKPGQVLTAAAELNHQHFATFVPLRQVEVRHARKVETVRRPLFGAYFFVRFDVGADRWQAVTYTFGIQRLFCTTPDRPLPVRRGIVEALQADAAADVAGCVARPVDTLIRAGARVWVTQGAFTSFGGPVLKVEGGTATVEVEIFGRATPATFPLAHLEPA